MSSTPKEHLLDWLRDAHAMEEQAVTMLSGLAERIENYPDLKAKIEEHLRETKRQAAALKSRIETLGSSTSAVKTAGGKIVAMGQVFSGLFVEDEVVKGSLASYTFEHMEIASYRILIAAAKEAGDLETVSLCQTILAEEERMAAWLEENLISVTQQYLHRAQTEHVTAKR